MSVDEKTAPFEVREFTSRDAAIAVLRTVEDCVSTAVWMLLGVGLLLMLVGFVGGGLPFIVASAVFAFVSPVCAVVGWRVSKGVNRLTVEDR